MFRAPLLPALLSISLLPIMSSAAPVSFDGSWKHQRFSLFSSNSYGFNGSSVSVKSDGAVSLAYRALDQQLWSATNARWAWQVNAGVPPTDLARKGGDDRNLAIYFVFLPKARAEQLKGAKVTKLLREETARVLVYVWGGDVRRGQVLASPYLGARGKTVVLRGAGTGAFNEDVDLARDFGRAFGGAPEALVGLAISGDSDDTDSRIQAVISNLQIN